jgi:hypothetical protein
VVTVAMVDEGWIANLGGSAARTAFGRKNADHPPMRAFWLFAMVWAACSPVQGASLDSPIAPAAQGQLQCYTPDVARRTCRSLAAYKGGAKGTIDNTAILLISQSPSISMTTVSPVVIKANQVCGLIRPRDIDAARFALDDRPADPAQTATLRQQMQSAMKSFFGHEICSTYVPADGSLLAKVTVDGASQPTMDQKVIWVSPTDGYKVSP